jgi:hypothetical protein
MSAPANLTNSRNEDQQMAAFSYGPNGEVYQEDCWQVLSTAAYILDGCDLPLLTIIDNVCAEFPKGPAPEHDAPPEEIAAYAVALFLHQLRAELPAWLYQQVGKSKRETIDRLAAVIDPPPQRSPAASG